MTRYFMDSDDDGHWYLVDAAKAGEWSDWVALDNDDERKWEPPPFAKPLDGHPSGVEFCDPKFV